MNSEKYIYVDISDIPDVMKVRTKYKIAIGVASASPRILYDGIVKLAKDIQQYVNHRVERDFGTDEYIITDTLFVIPPDCKRLAIPKPEPEKENEWIPVTERLPKKSGEYLVCYDNGDVTTDWYGFTDDGLINGFDEDIVAWMERPKPYKEERK